MLSEDYGILKEIVRELHGEAEKIETDIRRNSGCIRELQVQIRSLEESESDEFSVFYPGKSKSADREKMERVCREKNVYEERNEELNEKKEFLRERIRRLNEIISRQEIDSGRKEGFAEERSILARSLEKTADRMAAGRELMVKNPIQAKQEFVIAEKYVRKAAENIRNLI